MYNHPCIAQSIATSASLLTPAIPRNGYRRVNRVPRRSHPPTTSQQVAFPVRAQQMATRRGRQQQASTAPRGRLRGVVAQAVRKVRKIRGIAVPAQESALLDTNYQELSESFGTHTPDHRDSREQRRDTSSRTCRSNVPGTVGPSHSQRSRRGGLCCLETPVRTGRLNSNVGPLLDEESMASELTC